MSVHQIRHPRDAVDTAHQFALEVDNTERLGWMFNTSRERRARRHDALAVALLMLLMAALGCVVLLASTPSAKADTTSFAYAAHQAGAVCETIADYPSPAGVLGIMAAIRDDGLTDEQAAEVLVMSVSEVCPRYMFVLEAFADRGINA